MREFLIFTLAAPIASFGGVAGNERRGTMDRPGHSLVLGLLGAALGLERDDPDLLALSDALHVGVSMESRTQPLRDYHTVQTAKDRRGMRPATRKLALEQGDPNTIITQRDYLTDVLVFVAVTVDDLGPFTLRHLADALISPRFTLYLGRKSCPLALPVKPSVIRASSAEEAIATYVANVASVMADCFPVSRMSSTLAVSPEIATSPVGRREARRSRPGDRRTWSYRLLDELVLTRGPDA